MKMLHALLSVLVMVLLSGCLPDMQLPDNNAATEQWWWQDADGDGYGDEDLVNDGVFGLKPGANWAANPLDCDDSAATIYPNRAEARNGIDDDCDGRFDEHWRYMFVTELTDGSVGAGDGMYGSINQGPDAFCNTQKGTLPGSYRAWMSGPGLLGPYNRFTFQPADIDYDFILQDGTKIADGWADLTDGSLDAPINQMADGTVYTGYVWTSVTPDGHYDESNDNDQMLQGYCDFWTVTTGPRATGRYGYTGATDAGWTFQNAMASCTNTYAVICVQQADTY